MVSPSPARRPGPSDRSPSWATTIPVTWRTLARGAQDQTLHAGRRIVIQQRDAHRVGQGLCHHVLLSQHPGRRRVEGPARRSPGQPESSGRHTPWPARGLPALLRGRGRRPSCYWVRVDTIGPRRDGYAPSRSTGGPGPVQPRTAVGHQSSESFATIRALVTAPRRGAARAGARRPRRGTCRSSGHRSGRGRCR